PSRSRRPRSATARHAESPSTGSFPGRSRSASATSASTALGDSRPSGLHCPRTGKDVESPLSSLEQARRVAALAQEKLAKDVVILDMRPVCTYTDFFVVCSGGNPRQTHAIFDEVYRRLKQDDGQLPRSVAGEREGSWIVADYLDLVLH